MKNSILISILALSLSFVGCSYFTTQKPGDAEQGEFVHPTEYEIYSDIYLCDDVYITEDTKSYGNGTVSFSAGSDIFEVTDFKLLWCCDGCDRSHMVSRASQGYAPAYEVTETFELSGRYPVFKYKMELPDQTAEELRAQGTYDEVIQRINSSYHYLADLGEDIYAYVCFERKADAIKYEAESQMADEFIQKAFFDLDVAKLPFVKNQLYAVAYLGYTENSEVPDYSAYSVRYLEGQTVPVHRVSGGEWYLVIPRCENMELKLYKNNIEEQTPLLMFESKVAQPFIVCCNISDIFPDALIELRSEDGTAEFSPYISLKDGSVVVGEKGLDITISE